VQSLSAGPIDNPDSPTKTIRDPGTIQKLVGEILAAPFIPNCSFGGNEILNAECSPHVRVEEEVEEDNSRNNHPGNEARWTLPGSHSVLHGAFTFPRTRRNLAPTRGATTFYALLVLLPISPHSPEHQDVHESVW